MLTAIALLGFAFLAATALRRAAALAVGVAIGWFVWSASRDLGATFAAGAIASTIAAGIMDDAARARAPAIRRLSVSFEILASSTLAAWLAFLLARGSTSDLTLWLLVLLAAMVGAGMVLGKRRAATTSFK